jgi:hypothetical protein
MPKPFTFEEWDQEAEPAYFDEKVGAVQKGGKEAQVKSAR